MKVLRRPPSYLPVPNQSLNIIKILHILQGDPNVQYNLVFRMIHFELYHSVFSKGLVRMEILNKNDNLVVYSRESGDIDQFEAELIPLQGNSYLGEFRVCSE